MSKKSFLRRPIEKQTGKRARTLLKSALKHLYDIYIDRCQGNWVRESLSYWHAKSWDCLLTHWLRMTSILFLIVKISRYQLRYSNLRNKKLFLNFFLHFWNLNQILNILKKKVTLIDFVFSTLRTPKTWLDKCLKSPISENSSKSNMVNEPKHSWKLDHSTFTIFVHPCQGSWVRESLSYWHAKSCDCLLTHWLPMTSILFLIGTN